MIPFNKPLVFAPMLFLVLPCILIRIFYSEENNKDRPIYAVKTDFVSKVYIICTKIHYRNKNTVCAKTRSLCE